MPRAIPTKLPRTIPPKFQEPYQALQQPYPYQSQTMPQSQELYLEDLVNSLVTFLNLNPSLKAKKLLLKS